nr:MAG TPA: hypothetical protein [Caudoviricetes sp.]
MLFLFGETPSMDFISIYYHLDDTAVSIRV